MQEGLHFDERHYHFGLHTEAGTPKLLGRLLATGGIDLVRTVCERRAPAPCPGRHQAGAGDRRRPVSSAPAIWPTACCATASMWWYWTACSGRASRRISTGCAGRHRGRLSVAVADLRDAQTVADAARDAASVFHLAGQVAVTTSLVDPISDFEINLRGTINLLETLRKRHQRDGSLVPLVFASTNKVYGDLADIALAEDGDAYLPLDPAVRAHGIGEDRPLSFHTPYGCSKGRGGPVCAGLRTQLRPADGWCCA